jgi:outer membrane protein
VLFRSIMRIIKVISIICIMAISLVSAAENETISLPKALELAAKNNQDLKTQEARVRELEGVRTQQLGALLPQFDTNLNYTHYRPASLLADNYYFDITLKQILFAGGKYTGQLNSADAGLSAEKQKLIQVQRQVSLDVKNAYYEQLRSQYSLTTQKELIAKLTEQLTISNLLYNSGKISNLDLLKIQTQIASAEDILSNLTNQVYLKSLSLGQTLGFDLAVTAQPDLPEAGDPKKITDLKLEEILKANPEMLYSKFQLDKADADSNVAYAERWPSISLKADYNRENSYFFPESADWYAGIAITMPLFHGGDIRGSINKSKAQLEQSKIEVTQAELSLSLRFQSAKATLADKLNRVKTTKKVLDLSKEALTNAELKYGIGKLSALELIDAETVWNNALLNYYNNEVDYWIAYAQLEYLCPEITAKETK